MLRMGKEVVLSMLKDKMPERAVVVEGGKRLILFGSLGKLFTA